MTLRAELSRLNFQPPPRINSHKLELNIRLKFELKIELKIELNIELEIALKIELKIATAKF